ncbi:pro-neuregulin-4, membrane-bound isoform isoform X3 [Microtus pennsylvanicus]|uniref:pro-neuregulin-4, membrane-bound isoform isoform X3 n=1 Tax=Microtus pennsylvanicus TaxID=10058 RepID=UPI003F6B4D52
MKIVKCIENYTGARCEEVFLPSASIQSRSNLSAAIVALAILLTLAIAALCLLCRKGHFQRASSVQCEISLVERNTGAHHSHRGCCVSTITGHRGCCVSTITGHRGCCVSTITGHQGCCVSTITGHRGCCVSTVTGHRVSFPKQLSCSQIQLSLSPWTCDNH